MANYLAFKKSRVIFMAVILMIALAVFFLTCSKDEKPEIVGCNSIKYKGMTYFVTGCELGARSFNAEYYYGDRPCFYVECSRGCISSVSLCSGERSLSKTILGPDDEP